MKRYKINESWSGSAPSSSGSDTAKHGMSINVCKFQNELRKLPREKQEEVAEILSFYHQNRNVYYLVHSLKAVVNSSEQQFLFAALRQVIPKTDRPSYDQFTYEEIYNHKTASRSTSSVSQQKTVDSGISSAAQSNAGEQSKQDSRLQPTKTSRLSRSSSMSQLSYQKSDSSRAIHKRFSASTFGSAVRRKVRAALSRKNSTPGNLKSSFTRRYDSEPQLDLLHKKTELNSNHVNSSSREEGSKVKLIRVALTKKKRHKDFGFIIGGGKEHNSAIFVSKVERNSSAEKAGLSVGDVIVQINDDAIFEDTSQEIAATMLKVPERLTLHVKPRSSNPSVSRGKGFSWTDTRGRPASPPDGHYTNPRRRSPSVDSSKSNLKLLSAGERKVSLAIQPGQILGLVIRGGAEYGLGIYVTAVDTQSAAENAGLKVGDEILEVNNVRMEGASHTEAVNLIKSSRMLFMVVKHVGRIPHVCRLQSPQQVEENGVPLRGHVINDGSSPPNGIKDAFQRRMVSTKQQMLLPNMHVKSLPSKGIANISSTMAALEDALLASEVWMTLSDVERRSVRYYVKEYAAGNVTPDALVLSLSELLNDHEKFSLMSAVRECVQGRDLDRFDVLVLRREVEVLRNRHRSGDQAHENGTKENYSSESSFSAGESSLCLMPEAHSTPNQSYKPTEKQLTPPSAHSNSSRLSPVRPTTKPPPPPPPPHKTPPVKPKRLQTFHTTGKDSSLDSTTDYREPHNRDSHGNGERSNSPFSSAIANHKSSNSGRIKVGPKSPAHPPIPGLDFFDPPVARSGTTRSYSAPRRSLIEPVRNLSLRVKPPAAKNPLVLPSNKSVTSSNSSTPDGDLPPPPSSLLRSSMEESMTSFQSPGSVAFRASSFASAANDRVAASLATRQYPVTVDVHTTPSTIDYDDSSSAQGAERKITPFALEASFGSSNGSASDGVNLKKHPYLRDDVEKQKAVIFRTASTLGLVIEGGDGTEQPLPRVVRVESGSCAHMCGRVRAGHILHAVNGRKLKGLRHEEAVRSVALAFKERGRDSLELMISGPYD